MTFMYHDIVVHPCIGLRHLPKGAYMFVQLVLIKSSDLQPKKILHKQFPTQRDNLFPCSITA